MRCRVRLPSFQSLSSLLTAFGVILVVLFSVTPVSAQSPQQIFDQGSQSYQQGKFAEAVVVWEALLRNGYGGGEVYYNLGNAYYKTGNIAKAILNYERALAFMPNDDDLRHNLQLANLMITDKIEATPRLFVWEYWNSLKNALSLEGLTWGTYAFFVLTLLAATGVILARTYRLRRLSFLTGAFSLLVFLVFLAIFIGRVTDLGRKDTAIVVVSITTVKNSPDPKSSDAFVLHSGVKVQIIDKVSNWVKIRLVDGKVGWMEMDAAEVI